jgi:molecular chaperone HscA
MALLIISEPGESPDPHQRKVAVGIDLGTTNSLVAAVRHGHAECLPDLEGKRMLPSAVRYLGEGRRLIGREALVTQADDPLNTLTSFKRFMGRAARDVSGREQLPYEFAERSGMLAIRTREGDKTPVEASAEVLATLRQRAEDTFDGPVDGAVITVPAYFDDAQRQATKDAARLAGLEVLRLINEPTAAAVAYGLENGSEGLYAIYDLGGGTFDVSLLRLMRGVFEVVATGGDAALGGDDFDAALARWAAEAAGIEPVRRWAVPEADQPPRGTASEASAGASLTPHDQRSLLVAARAAKEALTDSASVHLRCRLSGARSIDLEVTRAHFDQLTRPLVDRTIQAARRVLRDAKVERHEVHGVVLVGGATRMPAVRAAVAQAFDREPLTNLNPDEVVALGAAIQAHQLVGNASSDALLLLDVIPLSLGLETMGGLVERIIDRNTTIPVARAQDFTTFKDGQTAMSIHAVQGERDLVADCRSLARFELRGIPPMAAGAARIRVTFQVDADGLLSVAARELETGVEASIAVKPSYGLADEDIARMLQEGFRSADDDAKARVLREAMVEAERLVLATQAALDADADLLDATERASIKAAMSATRAAREQADAHAIDDAVKSLARATEGFAAARMNRGIRQALAGKSLDEV